MNSEYDPVLIKVVTEQVISSETIIKQLLKQREETKKSRKKNDELAKVLCSR